MQGVGQRAGCLRELHELPRPRRLPLRQSPLTKVSSTSWNSPWAVVLSLPAGGHENSPGVAIVLAGPVVRGVTPLPVVEVPG